MIKTTLGQVADIITGPFGSSLHQYEYVSFGIPVIMPQDIGNRNLSYEKIAYITQEKANELSRYLVDTNDIVYARRGDIEKHAFITDNDKDAICGTGCLRVRIMDKNVNPLFLSFYLNKPETKKWISLHAVGSSMPNINSEILSKVPIVLPDKREQDSIASFLYNIDNKISNNNDICSDLESMAKLLYDYWFVQFDFPDENGKPYKSSGGKMVWNEELKREIPDGWEVNSLSEICDLSNGINYDKNEPGNKEYKIVNVRNITASSLLLNEEDFDRITLKSSLGDKYLIHDNDILIARSGTPGAIRLLEKVNDNTIYCGFIIRCSLYDKALRNYICYYLKMFEGTNATKTGGSILQNVSQETLNMIKIPMPKSDLIASFNKSTAPIIKNMQNSINENQELASLRDFLLPMLMNGQVKVKKEDGNE